MNEDDIARVPCPKCGEMMKVTARYCMKCGTINTNYETNKKLVKSVQKSIADYHAGIVEDNSMVAYATNTGNKKFAFLVTYLLYLFSILIVCLLGYFNGIDSFDILIMSEIPTLVVALSFAFIYIYATELIFIKCNKPWWAGLVPFYNFMILGEITFHSKYIGLICFIPIIGQIFLLVMLYKLGKKFEYSGLFTVLFSFIYVPMIGFSDHLYEGKAYVSMNDEKSLEKDYKYKKIFFGTLIVFLLAGIVLFIMGNMGKIRKTNEDLNRSYYVLASQKILKVVKNGVESGKIHCSNVDYKNNEGVYYIKYLDIGDEVHLPLYMSREVISAYIKIDNNKQPREYYVSLTDGEFGFSETLGENVTVDSVVDYTELSNIPEQNICIIN